MHILIVNPPNTPFTPRNILIEPIDTLLLATILKSNGFEITILDMDLEQRTNIPSFAEFDAVLVVHDYHIPLHNESTIENISFILTRARSENKISVLCGKYATYASDEQLVDLGADYYASFEAENTILDLFNSIRSGNIDNIKNIPNIKRRVHLTLIHNSTSENRKEIKDLPYPDRSLIDTSRYIDVRTMLSSRGCHQHCEFCHVPGFWGRWRARSPEQVVAEIKHIYQTTGSKKILFLDDNALVNRNRIQDICEKLISLNLPLTFGALASVDRVDQETLSLMWKAGFRWIHFGIESGDFSVFDQIKKRINEKQIKDAFSISKSLGFRTRASVILDLPGSTAQSIVATSEVLKEIEPDEIRLHYLSIRMGSTYFEEYSNPWNTQYIHHSQPGTTLSKSSRDELMHQTDLAIRYFKEREYASISSMDAFDDLDALKRISPDMKIIALCPIRYGLEWKK